MFALQEVIIQRSPLSQTLQSVIDEVQIVNELMDTNTETAMMKQEELVHAARMCTGKPHYELLTASILEAIDSAYAEMGENFGSNVGRNAEHSHLRKRRADYARAVASIFEQAAKQANSEEDAAIYRSMAWKAMVLLSLDSKNRPPTAIATRNALKDLQKTLDYYREGIIEVSNLCTFLFNYPTMVSER